MGYTSRFFRIVKSRRVKRSARIVYKGYTIWRTIRNPWRLIDYGFRLLI